MDLFQAGYNFQPGDVVFYVDTTEKAIKRGKCSQVAINLYDTASVDNKEILFYWIQLDGLNQGNEKIEQTFLFRDVEDATEFLYNSGPDGGSSDVYGLNNGYVNSAIEENPTASRFSLGLGSAALSDNEDFATMAQGLLAESALQVGDIVGVDNATVNVAIAEDVDATRSALNLGTAALENSETFFMEQYSSSKPSNYIFELDDAGKTVPYTSATDGTFTIPTNAMVAFPVGTKITIRQYDAGKIFLDVSAGVTTTPPPPATSNPQTYAPLMHTRQLGDDIVLYKTGTDSWDLIQSFKTNRYSNFIHGNGAYPLVKTDDLHWTRCIAIGDKALANNNPQELSHYGSRNVALGYETLFNLTGAAHPDNPNFGGSYNIAIGDYTLWGVTAGYSNVAVGSNCAGKITTGVGNVAVGNGALSASTTGNTSVGIGFFAGYGFNSTDSIFIGTRTKPQAVDQSNQIVIGKDVTGNGSNTTTIGNNDTTDTYLRGILHLDTVATVPLLNSLGITNGRSTAIGSPVSLDIDRSVLFGSGITASYDCTVIGSAATSPGNNSVVVGYLASSTSSGGIAVGRGARSTGNAGTSLGFSATTKAYGVGLGVSARAGIAGIGIGCYSGVVGGQPDDFSRVYDGSILIGPMGQVTHAMAVAIGPTPVVNNIPTRGVRSTADNRTTIGTNEIEIGHPDDTAQTAILLRDSDGVQRRIGLASNGVFDNSNISLASISQYQDSLAINWNQLVGTTPALTVTSVSVVADEAAQLALVVSEGSTAIRTDISKTYIKNSGTSGTITDWTELLSPTGGVTSIAGLSGVVTAPNLLDAMLITNSTCVALGSTLGTINSTVVGIGALAPGQSSAFGKGAVTIGNYATALGRVSSAEQNGIAVGDYAISTEAGQAVGTNSSAYGLAAHAYGYSSRAEKAGVALGFYATANLASVAIGARAGRTSDGDFTGMTVGSVGVGANANVTHDFAMALGPCTVAVNGFPLRGVRSTADNRTTIGTNEIEIGHPDDVAETAILLRDSDGTQHRLAVNKDGVFTNTAPQAPSIQTIVSASTVTPVFGNDVVKITQQDTALTLANPTGTIIDMFGMIIRIKDDGTSQNINYGSQYRGFSVNLPSSTVAGKLMYIAMLYNSEESMWDCISVNVQI